MLIINYKSEDVRSGSPPQSSFSSRLHVSTERVTDPAYWSSQKATAGIQQDQQFLTQLYNLQQTQALGIFRRTCVDKRSQNSQQTNDLSQMRLRCHRLFGSVYLALYITF